MRQPRPNILFVMADQLCCQALRAYGNATVDAPNLDALARDGVVFDSAYCNSPICAPSRASLLTGRLPSKIGVYDNGAELAASTPTLAHYLRADGYRTCLAGKMHFIGPDQLHGFEERVTTDMYPAGLEWTPDWSRAPGERLPWYHDMSSVLEPGVSEATLQTDFDDEVAFRSVRKILDLARSDDPRPFFLLASFIHPHDPWEVPSAYLSRYDGKDVDLPEVPSLSDAELDPHSRRIRSMCGDEGSGIGEQTVRNARRAYYAAVSFVDDKIGQLLQALEASGLREDTIVVVTSDHGEMLGERGLWYKMSFFEPSARVPLIVAAPSRFAPGRVAKNVSLIDLLPTLLEIAGDEARVVPVDPIEGNSLVPLLRGEDDASWPDSVFGEYLAEGTLAPMVMIRRGPYKYVRCPGDPDQLFDLSADPHELGDLAGSPAHAGVLRGFREESDERWDLDELHRSVVDSQRRRHRVIHALGEGRHTAWDYQPPDDSSARYVRGEDFWEPFAGARLRPDKP
jgi:choline-sulfatase